MAARRTSAVLALILAVAGCGEPVADPVPPVPEPPPLSGRILALLEDASTVVAIELPDGNPVPVVPDATAADLSPDGTSLAYVPRDGRIMLRNLADGSERELQATSGTAPLSAQPGCVNFSADGRRLAFLARDDNGLYVTTLDGAATPVDLPKRASYVDLEKSIPSVLGTPVDPQYEATSELSCGRWMSASRLVFDRVVEMPSSISFRPDQPTRRVAPDTTTVALLDGPVLLVDSPRRWRVLDRCGDQIISEVEQNRFVVDATGAVDGSAPSDRKLRLARAAFVDGTCDVLMTGYSDKGGPPHPTKRQRRDTGMVQDLPPVLIDDYALPSFEPDTVVWSPARDVWAASEADSDEGKVVFVNVDTGGSTVRSVGGPISRMLAWLPAPG